MMRRLVGKILPVRTKRKLKALPFLLYRFTDKVPLPKKIIIDPINMCNLNCPLCPTGLKTLKYDKCAMSFETFKTVVDKIGSLEHILFFNWGEPFLNPDILRMIKYATGRGIRVDTDSNFCLAKGEDFFTELVGSGLGSLNVSLDGAAQESYSKYRVGGNFDLVIHNMKELVRVKKKLARATPAVVWKFIVNRHNEHELGRARESAAGLGVKFMACKMGLADDIPDWNGCADNIEMRRREWLPKNHKYVFDYYKGEYKRPLYDVPCHRVFTETVINPDGKVMPCCVATNKENVFGDLLRESFEDIWHNDIFTYSRSLFINRKYSGKRVDTVCEKCDIFRKAK